MTPPAPATLRIPPPWYVALALLTLLAVAFILDHMGHPGWVDEPNDLDIAVHAWVIRHRPDWPWVTGLMALTTRFGNPNVATFATAVVTFGLYALSRVDPARVRRSEAVVWLGSILGGRLLSIGLKLVFRRERPPVSNRLVFEDTFSFPSGHSVFAAVFFTMLAVMLVRVIPPRWFWGRVAAVAACLTTAVTIGLSRVWLGVHYPTDVAGGLILGLGWVVAVALTRRGLDLARERNARGA
jgi:undecaprenyl-diphosphatase